MKVFVTQIVALLYLWNRAHKAVGTYTFRFTIAIKPFGSFVYGDEASIMQKAMMQRQLAVLLVGFGLVMVVRLGLSNTIEALLVGSH